MNYVCLYIYHEEFFMSLKAEVIAIGQVQRNLKKLPKASRLRVLDFVRNAPQDDDEPETTMSANSISVPDAQHADSLDSVALPQ